MFRLIVAVLVLLASTGCSRAQRSELTIYDWEAQRGTAFEHGVHDLRCKPQACPDPAAKSVYVFGAPRLSGDLLDRRSSRADIDPQVGGAVVLIQFTAKGLDRFERLTRTLARRGARRQKPQHFLLVIDDVVYTSPYIDYRFDPDGIRADTGIQLSVTSLDEARKLAKALRES